MSSTFHYEQSAGHLAEGRRFSGLTTSIIAATMLVFGIVVGSTGLLDEGRYPAAGLNETSRSVAAPAGARIYDDWRGNSAGVAGGHGSRAQ